MLPQLHSLPILKRTVSRLSKELLAARPAFVPAASPTAQPAFRSVRQTPFLQAFRSQSTGNARRLLSSRLGAPSAGVNVTAALKQTSRSFTAAAEAGNAAAKKSFFPETSDKAVAYWLLGSAVSVFGIVIWGGLTRLTESGLSITEWRPVTGSLPPMNEEDWESEFRKYRSSPEYALLNPNMTLDEFKKIYFMEWSHRVWGRLIGMTFVIPTMYFIARRRVSSSMAWKLVGICGLIGFQGVIGWWMVKSGLHDDLFAPGSHPRVSQYRLTAHLGAAFIVYAAMLLSGISILRERALLADPKAAHDTITLLKSKAMRPFTRYVTALTALVFITAMSGALVAGLDAGLIYNEFPWMGLGLTPPKAELFDPFYSHTPDQSDLWWRNMLENPSLVQLDHRILATTTFTAVIALFFYARSGRMKTIIPRSAHKGVIGMTHLALMQVTLGISTLIYLVPTWLAAAHQAGALALLTGALVLRSRVSVSRRTLKLLQRAWEQQGIKHTSTPGIGHKISRIESKTTSV